MSSQREVERDLNKMKQVVRDFIRGAATGDLELMTASIEAVDYGECAGGGWARAMRAAARLISVPRAVQKVFLQVYMTNGDRIREECDDLALADGLRVMLPKYEGPAMLLYRAESFRNRSRRTYGLSWTSSADIAHSFAENGFYRTFDGGSMLLETLAPPAAIICAPSLIDLRYGEKEYIVDRRHLTVVTVIDRFPQLSHEQFRQRSNTAA